MADPLYPNGTLVQAARNPALVMRVDGVSGVLVTAADGTVQASGDLTQTGELVYHCVLDPVHAALAGRGFSDRYFRETDLAPFAGAQTEAAVAARAAAVAAQATQSTALAQEVPAQPV